MHFISKTINHCGIDIAVLQEVDVYTKRSGRIHQAKEIAEILSLTSGVKWKHKFITSIKMYPGSYGNTIISRYPMKTVIRHHFKGKKDTEDRSFLLVCVKKDNKYYYVGTFHLGLGDEEMQAVEIKSILHKKFPGRAIIGGDLNAGEGTITHNIMCNSRFQMIDAGPEGTCTFECYDNLYNPKIDFWFASGVNVKKICSKVLSVDISDHRPVLTYVY